MPSAVSLFSGLGGFDLGAHRLGVDIRYAVDIDKYASLAYRDVVSDDIEFHTTDVRKIESFPRADLLFGCYPCTGFSQASRRRWRGRDRDLTANPVNYLFREVLRVAKVVDPVAIFIENVRGIQSACGGTFLNEQMEGLKSIGYTKILSTLVHSEMHGLAQTRRRLFVVAMKPEVADSYNGGFMNATHGTEQNPIRTLRDVIGGMSPWPTGEFFEKKFHGHFLTRNRKRSWDEPSYTIVADASHVPLHPNGEAMQKVGKDKWELRGEFNRRLSWRECALIQDLPEFDNADIPLERRYRLVGNAVPPLLAQQALKPLVDFLK